MPKRIYQSTLEKKCKKWQKVLKLSDWNITVKFASQSQIGNNTLAMIKDVYQTEKVAIIEVLNTYYNEVGHGHKFNIDTLLLHELVHLLVWEEHDRLPPDIRKSKAFLDFEEFLCDSFAAITYDIKKGS